MSDNRSAAPDPCSRPLLKTSGLRKMIGTLGDQVLWFAQIGESRVIMVAPSWGGKAAELRHCLDIAAPSMKKERRR